MSDTRTMRIRDLLEEVGTLIDEIVTEANYRDDNVIRECRMTLTLMRREASSLIANNEHLEKLL